MCRLFGFRSVLQSGVHSSLIGAENALALQSEEHPDGWGVAYYMMNAPHLVRSVQTAIDDHLFKRVSGIVSSQTVLAHLRKATIGNVSMVNTHPFQFGKWTFAHNGNLQNFSEADDDLSDLVDDDIQKYILGTTDSEVVFKIILTEMRKSFPLDATDVEFKDVVEAVKRSLDNICKLVGPFEQVDSSDPSKTFLTFVLTDGKTMLGHQGGKTIYYSTYKTECSDRGFCPFYAPECERPTETGSVNHLVFSSEPLSGENVWTKMEPGEIIGVDSLMRFHKT